jgi:hypothetical protein
LPAKLTYQRIEGKTYTLFGQSDDTDGYYQTIGIVADRLIKSSGGGIQPILKTIRNHSGKRAWLKKQVAGIAKQKEFSLWLLMLREMLGSYTLKTASHLQELDLKKRIWDRRLGTSEEQYHLYMLEIELFNRLNRKDFLSAGRKVAILPHCLRDLNRKCESAKKGWDYQCRHCSVHCYQNEVSRLLLENGIEPFIWMGSGLKKLARETHDRRLSLGILGIACIPELHAGMRRVSGRGIPVIGLPLNANRCIRWFGEFHPNSVSLKELEKLTGR